MTIFKCLSFISYTISAWPLPTIPFPSYGWYRADSDHWDIGAKILYDMSGNGNHATTGGAISLESASGSGATASIQYLTGDTSGTILWPSGSIPSFFTICSITRYVEGGKMVRILTATTIDWLHGHFKSKRGVAYYEGWKTVEEKSIGVLTNWVVICGKNVGTFPKNILVDGIASGVVEGGLGFSVLCINLGKYREDDSDWAFRELMIWNTALSDAEMAVASTALQTSLLYGQV